MKIFRGRGQRCKVVWEKKQQPTLSPPNEKPRRAAGSYSEEIGTAQIFLLSDIGTGSNPFPHPQCLSITPKSR